MNLRPLTSKAKDLLGNKTWSLYCFKEKVICFDNQPGYLFISIDNGWSGIWIRKDNDKNFQLTS